MPYHPISRPAIASEINRFSIVAGQLRGGTIGPERIVLAGGDEGVIQSENFESLDGATGWAILGDGTAFFGSDVTIRGTLISGASTGEVILIGVVEDDDGDSSPNRIRWTSIPGGGLGANPPQTFAWIEGSGGQVSSLTHHAGEHIFETNAGTTMFMVSGQTAPQWVAVKNGAFYIQDGTESAPGLAFDDDEDIGIFLNPGTPGFGAGIGFSTGGTERLTITTDGDVEHSGSAYRMTASQAVVQFEGSSGPLGIEWVGSGSLASPEATLYFRTTPNTVSIENAAGAAAFTIDIDNFQIDGSAAGVYNRTTGNPSNARFGTSGQFLRSTSSRRWKTGIRPWDNRATALDLEPRLFRSTADADDGRIVRLGLIAEEVAEVSRLFVTFDDKNEPDAVNFDAVTVALLAEVKQLRSELDELRAKMGAS